jgi:hypothetical protein
MATHAVIGTGTAPSKVIMDGLAEAVENGDTLSLVWTGAPKDGSAIESVYAFVKDSETPTTVYHEDGQNIPQALRSWDNVNVVKTRHPLSSALDSISEDGVVLFLWNDDKPEEIEEVYDHSEDHNIMELSNGLCPIVLDDSVPQPTPAPKEVPTKSKAPELLSIDELEVMTAAAVKQYGQDMGCEARTKAGIIEEIAARMETEVPSIPEPVADEPAPVVTVDGVSFPTTKTDRKSAPNWDQELTILINNFMQFQKPGFEADMAHLCLGQARLWMMKALNSE